MGAQKKKLDLAKPVINHASNSEHWWNMPKRFSGIITHYISSSVWRTASRNNELHTVAAVFLHKQPSLLRESDCGC